MKYYNSNKVQVFVASSKNPDRIYAIPAKATVVIPEELKHLPEGVRVVKEKKRKKK